MRELLVMLMSISYEARAMQLNGGHPRSSHRGDLTSGAKFMDEIRDASQLLAREISL